MVNFLQIWNGLIMKKDRQAENLLHAVFDEIAMALELANYPDRIELDSKEMRKLLKRYYAWRHKQSTP